MHDKVKSFVEDIFSFIPEDVKTLLAVCLTWLYGVLGDNPVGAVASVLGLLYAFEKYRTQRIDRKLKDEELKIKLNESE